MSIIKPKISSLVPSQLPEFIREDYQTFVAFLEAYYQFLERDVIVDFNSIGDIDKTLDSFIVYFKNELALNFPSLNVDDRFLLPKIKELYTAKGSEASYRLLFRLLYGKEIQIDYPSTQMLRVSDGKWVQDTSIFVNITVGTPDSVVGQIIKISTYDKTIRVFIDSYKTTSDPNVYELFITGGWTGIFGVGSAVSFNTTFAGSIKATTKTVSITQSGKNFSVGQVYALGGTGTGTGTGSSIVILKVDNNGGILLAKLISFGIEYTNNFTTSILSSSSALIAQNYFTINAGGTSPITQTVKISDSITQLSDYGVINSYNYTSDTIPYVEPSYAGTIISSFNNVTSYALPNQLDYAIVSIEIGSFAKYPGYYKNDDGFLDSTQYIQDSKFYQAFSYVIKIDEKFESYKSVVRNLLHPSGTSLFGEYQITKVSDLSSTAQTSAGSLLTLRGINLVTSSGKILGTKYGIINTVSSLASSTTVLPHTTLTGFITLPINAIASNTTVLPRTTLTDFVASSPTTTITNNTTLASSATTQYIGLLQISNGVTVTIPATSILLINLNRITVTSGTVTVTIT